MSSPDQPLVSIITPAYNAGRFIADSITSVRNQTYPNWEMLIVNDHSTDNTINEAESARENDKRVRILNNTGPSGVAHARNTAIHHAQGKFIAFLDSDDTWLPNKLEEQIGYMLTTGAAITCSQYRRIDENGSLTGRLIEPPNSISYHQLLKHNVIACLTAVIDREQTGDFEMIDEGYDDYILWLEILKRGFVAHGIQKDLARYRRVEGSLSFNWNKAAKWVWNIYSKVEKLPLPYRAWCFANYSVRVYSKHLKF